MIERNTEQRIDVLPRFEVANCDLKELASMFEVANCDLKRSKSSLDRTTKKSS